MHTARDEDLLGVRWAVVRAPPTSSDDRAMVLIPVVEMDACGAGRGLYMLSGDAVWCASAERPRSAIAQDRVPGSFNAESLDNASADALARLECTMRKRLGDVAAERVPRPLRPTAMVALATAIAHLEKNGGGIVAVALREMMDSGGSDGGSSEGVA